MSSEITYQVEQLRLKEIKELKELNEKLQSELADYKIANDVFHQAHLKSKQELEQLKSDNEFLVKSNVKLMKLSGTRADQADEYKNTALKFQEELLEAREVIKFYADDENMYDLVYESGGDFIGYIPNEDDFSHIEGTRYKHFGKRAREFMKKYSEGE